MKLKLNVMKQGSKHLINIPQVVKDNFPIGSQVTVEKYDKKTSDKFLEDLRDLFSKLTLPNIEEHRIDVNWNEHRINDFTDKWVERLELK